MGKTILIVEDEPDIVKLIEYKLQRAGFETICAYDGISGEKQAQEHLPDLIILDLMLPELDGFEVCKSLKRDEKTANIPILMLTAREEELDRIFILSGLLACVLSFFLIFGISKVVTRPLRRLTSTAEKLSQGELDVLADASSNDEVGYLAHTFNRMAKRLQKQIRQLSEERDRLEAIFANMAEGIILLDEQFNIIFANLAIKDIFQIRGEISGQSLLEAIRNPDISKLLQKASFEKQTVLEELTAFTPLRKQLHVGIVPIIQDTQLEGASEFILVIHDISQLRKLERMRAEFVANVSHELRTPLTSIHGYAEPCSTAPWKMKITPDNLF